MSVIQHFPYGKAKVMDSQKSHHKPLSSLCSAAQGLSRVAAEPASDSPLLCTGRVVSMSVSRLQAIMTTMTVHVQHRPAHKSCLSPNGGGWQLKPLQDKLESLERLVLGNLLSSQGSRFICNYHKLATYWPVLQSC